jgi:hypothetical protein
MGESKNTQEAETKQHGKPGFKNGRKQGKPQQSQSLNSDAVVPMLHFDVANNFDLFKRKVSIACLEKHKNLGRLIMDEITTYLQQSTWPSMILPMILSTWRKEG